MNGIRLIDGDEETATVHHVFGGRLISSEYVLMDDGNQKVPLHKVHIDLIMDTAQYIAFLQSMAANEGIEVSLVQ